MSRRYAKVSVPVALRERLVLALAARPDLGYRSASDAVTECVRRLVERLETHGKADGVEVEF